MNDTNSSYTIYSSDTESKSTYCAKESIRGYYEFLLIDTSII